MRIGFDGFPLCSPKTGIGHYTFELARALALIAPADEFEFVSPVSFPNSVLKEISDNWPANLGVVNPKASKIIRRWWAVGLPLYVKQASLDIFHGTNYEVPLWNRRRSVVTIHDLSFLLHPETLQQHLMRRARRRLPIMIRAAGMILTPTESVKREICEHLKLNPEKIVVTPEAPRPSFQPMALHDTAETKRRLGIEDDFILFVGTIEPRKNLLTLVRAFEKVLWRTTHRPQLVIAGGEGWLMDELHLFIKKSKIGDRLRMTGYLLDSDLRALYSSCRLFVYPSLYEGFGLPPLEAMACGAPVIASRIPALVETLRGASRLVDPTDDEALSNTIIELLENETECQGLSSAGLQHAGNFSWERTARLTLEAYYQLLGKMRTDREASVVT